MSAHRLTPAQQRDLGIAVLAARRSGCPWKLLEATYCRSRVQLWRYAQAARAGKDVSLGLMKHLDRCAPESVAA